MAGPWLSGLSEPAAPSAVAQGLAVGRDRGREQAPLPLASLHLPSTSLIPHLVPQNPQRRPELPIFPRLNIRSHAKKKELENCVTVPSGETCPNLTLGKGRRRPGVSSAAAGCCPPGPCFRHREMPVPPPPPKRDSRGSFCTALWVALIKGPIFSTNLAFLAESTDAPICVFGLGHQSKDWLKKVMHVRAFLLLGSGPGRGGRREVGWFVFKQLFILLPLNFWSEEVFLPPPPSFRVFLCIALLFGFPLFSDSRKKFY